MSAILSALAVLALCGILLTGAIGKALSFAEATDAALHHGAPERHARSIVFAIILLEAALGLLLLFEASQRLAAFVSFLLFAAFAALLGRSVARGETAPCRCFGKFGDAATSWRTVLRTATCALLALVLAVFAGNDPLGVAAATARTIPIDAPMAALVIGGLLIAAFQLQLLGQQGRMLVRLDSLERRLGDLVRPHASGLPAGAEAPDFELELPGGGRQSLGTAMNAGRAVVLVFLDPGCATCHGLAEAVNRFAEATPQIGILVVSRGSADANRRLGIDGDGLVLLQSDFEVAALYGIEATPAAVLVAKDQTIASPFASGAPAVQALLDHLSSMALVEKAVRPSA